MVGDPSSHAISAAAGLLNTGISMFLLPHLPGWHGAADLGPSSTGRGRPYGQLNTILTGLDHGIVGSYMQGLYPVAHRTSGACSNNPIARVHSCSYLISLVGE